MVRVRINIHINLGHLSCIAQVTPHLHYGVTHILCDIQYYDYLEWTTNTSLDVFRCIDYGMFLRQRMLLIEEERENILHRYKNNRNMVLVSPRWIKKEWNKTCT